MGGKKRDGAREIREIPRNIEGIFPRDVFEISKSYQTGSSPSRNARIANRPYQSAISHRCSDYHNSRNSGIAPISRHILRAWTTLRSQQWILKGAKERTISPIVDLDLAITILRTSSCLEGRRKDLVTMKYPDWNLQSVEFPRKRSDDRFAIFQCFSPWRDILQLRSISIFLTTIFKICSIGIIVQ